MKKNLIFIGMPAVGKSTVGIVVAKRLGMNFIDADLLIQEQEKRGDLFVIRPHSSLPVKRMEKDPAKLKTCYEMGRQAAETARERLLAFLKK